MSDKTNSWLIAMLLVVAASLPAVAAEPTGIEVLMPHYEAIRLQLVDDSMDGVAAPAKSLRAQLREIEANLTAAAAGVPGDKLDEVAALLPEAVEAARRLEEAEELEAARKALYDLTKPLVRWRQAAGDGPEVAYCPMKKQSWLQPEGAEIGNPYYGQMMAGCGEIVDG